MFLLNHVLPYHVLHIYYLLKNEDAVIVIDQDAPLLLIVPNCAVSNADCDIHNAADRRNRLLLLTVWPMNCHMVGKWRTIQTLERTTLIT